MRLEQAVAAAMAQVQTAEVRSAVVYLEPNLVVKATAQRRLDKRASGRTFLVTIGKPNYQERQFVRDCKAAGVRFPVRSPQLRFW